MSMYRRPSWLDQRINDELYAKLMDIASMETESFMAFGSLQDHVERAVIAAALAALDSSKVARKKKL